MKRNYIKASEFDKRFDDNEDIVPYLDRQNMSRPGIQTQQVKVDLPQWMIQQIDQISKQLHISRQSVIKVFISDRLKKELA